MSYKFTLDVVKAMFGRPRNMTPDAKNVEEDHANEVMEPSLGTTNTSTADPGIV